MSDAISREAALVVPDYDAGLLNDWGGGNVEWWQDYLRAEIGRANEHWSAAIAALPAVTPGVKVKPLVWETARDGYPLKWQAWCNLMAGYYYADSDGQKREHEAARAARILAALDLTPQPVPAMRPETDMEHIARDMRDARLPERSERQVVPVDPQTAPDVAGLVALLKEARDDLAAYVDNDWPEVSRAKYPPVEAKWKRDMELCSRIDAALAAMDGQP